MMEKLARQIKILQVLIGALSILVIASCTTCIYLLQHNGQFATITTQRINIAEADGKLKMVISNQASQHPGMLNHKPMAPRNRPAGIIFFNDEGDECGGLVYDGDHKSASMTYSIDQFKNDQIMQLQYQQLNEAGKLSRSYGMKLWDRPDDYPLPRLIGYTDSLQKLQDTVAYRNGIEHLKSTGALGRERLFAGKNTAGEVGLFLRDAQGVLRLKIYIDAHNQPVIETLNAKGEVLRSK